MLENYEYRPDGPSAKYGALQFSFNRVQELRCRETPAGIGFPVVDGRHDCGQSWSVTHVPRDDLSFLSRSRIATVILYLRLPDRVHLLRGI